MRRTGCGVREREDRETEREKEREKRRHEEQETVADWGVVRAGQSRPCREAEGLRVIGRERAVYHGTEQADRDCDLRLGRQAGLPSPRLHAAQEAFSSPGQVSYPCPVSPGYPPCLTHTETWQPLTSTLPAFNSNRLSLASSDHHFSCICLIFATFLCLPWDHCGILSTKLAHSLSKGVQVDAIMSVLVHVT